MTVLKFRTWQINMVFTAVVVTLGFLTVPHTAKASTLSEILTAMKDARGPENLQSVYFNGRQDLDLVENASGFLPEDTELFIAWQAPDNWLCTYDVDGEIYSGNLGFNAHPAVDHVFFARPDFIDFLDLEWTVQYQGSANWEGEPAYSLLFRPTDLTLSTPPFTIYISKDTMMPMRTEVVFSDGTTGVTDFSWVVVDEIYVPVSFESRFSSPIGPLNGYTTAYFNHSVNSDVTHLSFPRLEGTVSAGAAAETTDDSPALFDELYHGFEDDPIIVDIADSEGNYDQIEFTFTLYVDDGDVFWRLDDVEDEIRDVATSVISTWDWSGAEGLGSISGKYECGREIRDAINVYLETSAVTDFYFITFEPLSSEE